MNKFSPSTRGFYDALLVEDYIAAGVLPADATDVSPEDEQIIREALVRGDAVSIDIHGAWTVTPAPRVPFAELSAPFLAEVRTTREFILNRLAGIGMAAMIDGDTATAGAIAQIRQRLLDITEAPSVLAAIAAENLGGLEEAVKLRYKEIAAAVPLAVRNAFNQVSQ
ncbi:hypothetical protein SAMN05518865_110159 [Duganella sp. CF458]|uniref:hypothetical protein n=1 Tax=Duganella sp. CF458 TaxID=1884368 RepID=UPI0008EA777B|nr:hypothetical protein [Duganella sp. CF458]SFG29300.1 hypothetical protein SAMN05518865_110159 [Duganella sp. CF458]